MSAARKNPLSTGQLSADHVQFMDDHEEELTLWDKLRFPLRWLAMAIAVGVAIWAFRYYQLNTYVTPQNLQAFVTPYGAWAPLVFVLMYIPIMLLMVIPFSLMAGISALIFGLAQGMLWSILGGTLGATAVFLMTRFMGRGITKKQTQNPKMLMLNQRLERDGFFYLLFIRALSVVPYNLLNALSGLTSLKLRDFVLANLIGLIPSAFIYGYGTQVLLDPNASKTSLVLLGAIIVFLVLPPLIFKQYRKQKRAAGPGL